MRGKGICHNGRELINFIPQNAYLRPHNNGDCLGQAQKLQADSRPWLWHHSFLLARVDTAFGSEWKDISEGHQQADVVYNFINHIETMTNRKPHVLDQCPKARAYEMLDEPVPNPRYGGLTMREDVKKALKWDKRKPGYQDELPDGEIRLGV